MLNWKRFFQKLRSKMVSGITTTRIEEIRKYKPSEVFEENYKQYDSTTKTGLVSVNMEIGEIIYYINNIKYIDVYENGDYLHTYFECIPYEILQKNGGVLIKKDIFINRHEKSIMKENNLLSELNSFLEIKTFVGGNYFNIHKN